MNKFSLLDYKKKKKRIYCNNKVMRIGEMVNKYLIVHQIHKLIDKLLICYWKYLLKIINYQPASKLLPLIMHFIYSCIWLQLLLPPLLLLLPLPLHHYCYRYCYCYSSSLYIALSMLLYLLIWIWIKNEMMIHGYGYVDMELNIG